MGEILALLWIPGKMLQQQHKVVLAFVECVLLIMFSNLNYVLVWELGTGCLGSRDDSLRRRSSKVAGFINGQRVTDRGRYCEMRMFFVV